MKPLILATLALLAAMAVGLQAATVDTTMTLVNEPGFNAMAITVNVPLLGPDTDTSNFSGTVETRLEMNPDTGAITSLHFLSGNVTGTPVSFSRSVFLVGRYDLNTSSIGGTIVTPAPPAPVDGAGRSPAELHEFTINSGTVTGSGNVTLVGSFSVNENFADTPISGSGQPGEFVTVVATRNIAASTPTLVVYDLEMQFPVDISEQIEVSAGVNATVTASGTLKAASQVSFAVAGGTITYVDADLANTTGPAGWFEATASGSDGPTDNKWRLRTGMGTNEGNAFVATGGENVPEITTTVSGVANGVYDVFVFFWDNNGTGTSENWDIAAGLTSGSLTAFKGNSAPNASALTFVSSLEFGGTGTTMRYGYLGQVAVSDGTLQVFVDDFRDNEVDRTWYDGIGYRLAGDNITMTGSDASGATSFNAGTNWPGGAAPVAGNNYFTGANLLRTPTSGSHTFAGASLTINSGGSLAFKGDGIITVNNLILAGGTVSQIINDNTTASLAGAITLADSTTSTLSADGTNRQINVSATIGGNGNLTKTSVNTLTLSGTAANTHTGTTTLSAGKLVLGKSAGVNAIGGNLTIAPSSGWANAANGVELAANEQSADSAVISLTGTEWSGFRLKGFTETVGGLSAAGKGVIENSGFGQSVATDGTLIIHTADGTSYTYNGYIRNRDAGSSPGKLNLTKTGLGTQILLNSNITYTGTTTINQGTLKLSQTTGYASPTTTVGAAGTLELNKTATGPANRTSQLTRSITGSGTLNINSDTSGIGGGWVTLRSGGSNLVNFTGTINVKSGVLSMDNLNGTLTGNPDLNMESGGLFGIRGQDVSVDALTGSGDVFNGWNGDTAGKTLTVGANNGSGTFSGVIHGNNSTNPTDFTIEAGRLHLTKTGTGTQTLTGANTYSGQTTVSAGTLLLGATGSIANSSTIDVKSGATFDVLATGGFTVGASQTLKGSGTINGATAISGTLAPGDSAGTLTTNDVTFEPGSSFAFEIADWNGVAAGTDWDLLAADTLVFNNTPASKLTLVISGPDANFGEANRTFPIATAATSITGFDPAAVAIDASASTGSGTWAVQQNGLAIELVYTTGAGNNFAAWAAANAPGQTIDMDHDHDGVPNGIEFFMGESGSGFTAMPALDASRTIAWTKDPAYPGTYGTHYVVETSTNLVDWDPVLIGDVTIGATVDYTIPDGVPARFARLKVTGP